MKKLVKYFIAFLLLSLFVFVICSHIQAGLQMQLIISAVISATIIFFFRNMICKLAISNILLFGSFILIISAPLVGKWEKASLEKRQLSDMPEFQLKNVWKFFTQYKKYFEDRFAFRNASLQLIAILKLELFKISSIRDKVEVGKDEWLFSSGKDYTEYVSKPFSEAELKLIKANLELITLWLKERKIKYYFACIPVKAHVYPDLLPPILQQLHSFSKVKQLYQYLDNDSLINIVDVSAELKTGRKIRDTYSKTDTHWNSYGAFLGYEKIMKTISKDFAQLKYYNKDDYNVDSINTNTGDLLAQMGLQNEISYEYFKLTLKNPAFLIRDDSTNVGPFSKYVSITTCPNAINNLKLFVIRDSYTEILRTFLSPTFNRCYYLWKPQINVSLIIKEQPNIVLHEMLEIFINHNMVLADEIKADTTFMNKYYPNYESLVSKVDFATLQLLTNP